MLDLLETFVAVAEAGSLNKAADAVHRTQPAVTRQIRSLEQQLGAVLLTRSSSGVTLTPAGVAVLPFARQTLAAVAACRHAAREAAAGRATRLSLASGQMVTLYLLPPVIARFRALYPDVEVALHLGAHGDAVRRLLDYEVDAAVISSDVHVPQVRAYPVFDDPLRLVSAPMSAATPVAHLTDLAGRTLLLPPPQTSLRPQVERALSERGVAAAIVEHPTAETIKTAVALGLGTAVLPHSVVQEDVAAGRLVATPIEDWPDAHRTVRVLVRAEGGVPAHVRALIRLLQEQYGRE